MRPAPALALALLLAVSMLCAGARADAAIHGSVKVPPPPPEDTEFRPYAGRASRLPEPVRPPKGVVTDAVLYLEALPVGAAVPFHTGTPMLAQRGQAFEPRVVVVPAGGEVRFPNFDPIYHNVFSVSPAKRFDLGKYPRGQSRSIVFPKPGLVNVFCDIHSNMAAFILVVPNEGWVRPGPDGRFTLAGTPPGHYKLHWWHPDFPAGESDVDVPASGDVSVDVTF